MIGYNPGPPPVNIISLDNSLDHYYKCCSYPKIRRRFIFFGKIVCRNCKAEPVFAYSLGYTGSTGPH